MDGLLRQNLLPCFVYSEMRDEIWGVMYIRRTVDTPWEVQGTHSLEFGPGKSSESAT